MKRKRRIKGNKVISDVTVNYKKYDMKKFVRDNVAMKSYVNKNTEYTLAGAKQYYESIGSTCK